MGNRRNAAGRVSWRGLAVKLGIAVSMAGTLALAYAWQPYLLADYWQRRLAFVNDDVAATVLLQLAELGDAGLPVVIESLGSPREGVAAAAEQVLLDEVDRWELLDQRDSSPKLALLADELSNHVSQFGPSGRRVASQLALRILLWPTDESAIDQGRLLAACEAVMRAARAAPPDGPRFSAGEPARLPSGDASGIPSDGERLGADRGNVRQLNHELLSLPGGGLPAEPSAVPELPPVPAAGVASDRGPSDAESGVSTPASSEPLTLAADGLGANPLRSAGASDSPTESTGVAILPNPIRQRQGPAALANGAAAVKPAALELLDLMRRLRSDDFTTAQVAEYELRRRGFEDLHIRLARRLNDPDPLVRRTLAGALWNVPGIDAGTWLLWLSRDEDAEVRLESMTLLATSGDPRLMQRVEAMSTQDPDPEIRRQAARAVASLGGRSQR